MADTTTLDFQDAMSALDDAVFDARTLVAAQLRRIVPHLDVGDIDIRQPLHDEADLDAAGLAALADAISAAAGRAVPTDLIGDRTSLDDVAHALAARQVLGRWQTDRPSR